MGLKRYRIQNEGFDYFRDVYFYLLSFLLQASETNRFIEGDLDAERKKFHEFEKSIESDPTWEGEWFEYHMDLKSKEGLKDIYIDSQIVVIYSFIERKMLFLCRYYENILNIPMKVNRHRGIFRYRRYLEETVQMDFLLIQSIWNELVIFSTLRNIIVHNEGDRNIQKEKIDLIKYLNETDGIVLTELKDAYSVSYTGNQIVLSFYWICNYFMDFLFHEDVQLK